MAVKRLLVGLVLLMPTGCFFVGSDTTGTINGTVAQTVSELLQARVFPGVPSGRIGIRFVNDSGSAADTRVTMRVDGELVHRASRRLDPRSAVLSIGPDQADTVVVEVTLADPAPRSLPIATFRLGADFRPGDTITITIPADEPQPEPAPRPIPEPEPEPKPGPATIAFDGFDQDLRVNPGTPVEFNIVTSDASGASVMRVFADPDTDPDNGNELSVADGLPAAATTTVVWNTADVPPGLYTLFAELSDETAMIRSEPAVGRVRINASPQFVFVDPRQNLIVTLGRDFMVTWAAQDDDDNASIRIFLDRNTDASDGIELLLAENISEDDIENRELRVDTADLAADIDEIFVGAEITDGLSTITVYTGRVCLTPRLVGRFVPDDLGESELTILRGGPSNSSFGAAIDLSGSYNADASADLLIGDPLAWDGPDIRPGAVFARSGDGAWPRELTVDDMDVTFFGEADGSQTGQRVGLLRRVHSDNTRDVLIGAPMLFDAELGIAGRGYRIDGASIKRSGVVGLDSINPFQSSRNPPPRPGATGSKVTGSLSEHLGLDAAALGDLDADGTPDYALAGTNFIEFKGQGRGRITIISGDATFIEISADEVGGSSRVRGLHVIGDSADALSGHTLRSLHDSNGDGADELLIAAPAADFEQTDVGLVYMIYGDAMLFDPDSNLIRLSDIGVENGRLFVGQNSGDLAGAALATGNFDGVGADDLLIGAPGYDNARGRVYLISEVDSLPPIVHLADIGTAALPGVVFEGMAPGDQLGFSLANAGDTDGDSIDELLIGAPGLQGRLGAAFLIYGGQTFSAVTTLFEMPTCLNLQGWQLTGDIALGRLGAALSGGGDVNIDSFADVALGAPGDPTDGSPTGGAAYLIFGRGAQVD